MRKEKERHGLERVVGKRNGVEIVIAEDAAKEDAIRPKHYRKGLDDLMEGWYRTQPWNEWRTSMVNLAERYFRRDKADPVEDIDKGIYVMKRVREKELERLNNKERVNNET